MTALSIAKLSLNTLSPVLGSKSKKKRVGRGEGSGLGKTSGRGGKGQTARSGGKVKRHFEGGQMPLYRRLPKVGFTSRKRILGTNKFEVIKLSSLEIFDNGTTVNLEVLANAGLAKSQQVKILSSEGFTKKLNISGVKTSESAKKQIEQFGGVVA